MGGYGGWVSLQLKTLHSEGLITKSLLLNSVGDCYWELLTVVPVALSGSVRDLNKSNMLAGRL